MTTDGTPAPGGTAARTFLRAALNTLANPKVVLFYAVFLPQFVDPALGHVTVQLLVLGALFLLVGLAFDVVFGLLAGHAGQLLRRRPSLGRLANRLAGTIFAGLAVRLAAEEAR